MIHTNFDIICDLYFVSQLLMIVLPVTFRWLNFTEQTPWKNLFHFHAFLCVKCVDFLYKHYDKHNIKLSDAF